MASCVPFWRASIRYHIALLTFGVAAVVSGSAVSRALAAASVPSVRSAPAAQAARRAPTIAFVPLDDRPVTYQLPIMLGAIAGQPVLTPPRAELGNYLRAGDGRAILHWLQSSQTAGVNAIVASTDMLAYGGLVAARIPGVSAGDAYVRLRALATLKSERDVPFVGVFGTIMRLAPTGLPALGAASDHYATGKTVDEIQKYANLTDPPQSAADRSSAAALQAQIGPPLATYLATRARDLAVDQWTLQMAADGGYDRVVLGQDDAGPVGLHLKDVAALRRTIARFGLGDRAAIEPGADELGMVMLARVFAYNVGWTPTIAVRYSRPDGGAVVDKLEYVPIDATIDRIIAACGAQRADRESSSSHEDGDTVRGGERFQTQTLGAGRDAPVARNAFTSAAPADIYLYVRVADTNASDEEAFEAHIAGDVAAGRSVAVADLTFLKRDVGPEQQQLTESLIARGIAGKIDAFASWNTDANTVGTALPEAIAVGAGRRAGRYDARAHAQFMLDRYIDDYAFHQFVRPNLNAALRTQDVDPTLLLPEIAAQTSDANRSALWRHALSLLQKIYPQYADAGLTITLPWSRTFETQIDVRLNAATP